jgi:hypothetical protein
MKADEVLLLPRGLLLTILLASFHDDALYKITRYPLTCTVGGKLS